MKSQNILPWILLLLLLGHPAGANPPDSGIPLARRSARAFFPKPDLMRIGAYYYPEQWPREQWERDLGNMARLGFEFTHFAEFQARIVVRNILLPRLLGLLHARADGYVLPWCTFTEPEIARVGLNEKEAARRGVPHRVHRFDFGSLDRAILDGADVSIDWMCELEGTESNEPIVQ